MTKPQPSIPCAIVQRVFDLNRPEVVKKKKEKKKPAYPPISSIPRTPPSRLAAATPSSIPEGPVPSSSAAAAALQPNPDAADTVLYLAYGSNLCAETFLGKRGIRPLSRTNVSAPSLRLTFDLPGVPYKEPCFANTAPRKLPKIPGKPPKLPDLPDLPPAPASPRASGHAAATATIGGDVERAAHGDPVWDKGLIGVVYEVTRADFAHIVATEGGGASYQDILVPCVELPPSARVPERPPIPELPHPFLAHTLYAPRLPDGQEPDDPDRPGDGGSSSGADNKLEAERRRCRGPARPKLPGWAARLLMPARRPDPEYAQPSARYLKLLRDGARENDLPPDYRAWLDALQPYTVTSRRQTVGQVILLALMVPFFAVILALRPAVADKQGRVPLWMAVAMGVLFNVTWMWYDHVLHPLFGDGERTEDDTAGRGSEDQTIVEKDPAL